MIEPSTSNGPDTGEWALLLPLLREINDLKRIRSPEFQPSIAAMWFRSAALDLFHWPRGVESSVREHLAHRYTANVVAATRLGAISVDDLTVGGLTPDVIDDIRSNAIHERKEAIDPRLISALLESVGAIGRVDFVGPAPEWSSRRKQVGLPDEHAASTEAQDWIDRLIAQPRAGATAPGQPRIVLEPVESCAEHCFITAVYAVLLAPSFGADVGDVFAVGLAHHLHNARLPDAGFAGEALIGNYLDGLIATLREATLATMSPHAAAYIGPLLEEIASADTPLARTFHTADTIDRVLQIEYFARSNQFTLNDALVGMELVHAGPVQAFQQGQLDAAGLGGL